MSQQPEALQLADALERCLPHDSYELHAQQEAAAELRRLDEENRNLKTVMVAAAEEISAHWDAHCDSEGYGPVNLLRRLEEGIPSEYGYTAGAFEKLERINAQLLEALELLMADERIGGRDGNKARAAIAAAKEQA